MNERETIMETREGATIDTRRAVDTRAASSSARRARSERSNVVAAQDEKVKPASIEKDGQVKPNYHDGDWVELHSKEKIEEARQQAPESLETELFGSSWNRGETAYDYELSEFNDLIVKIVDRENRSEVVRQYPTKEQMTYKNAFRKFMELIGL